MRQHLKNLWNQIQDADPLYAITYAMAILTIGIIVALSVSCAAVRDTSEIVAIVKETMKGIDQDGSGSISMTEIIQYCVGGWVAGRATETAGKLGVKKFRHGRKQSGDRSNEHSSSSDSTSSDA